MQLSEMFVRFRINPRVNLCVCARVNPSGAGMISVVEGPNARACVEQRVTPPQPMMSQSVRFPGPLPGPN